MLQCRLEFKKLTRKGKKGEESGVPEEEKGEQVQG